MTDAHTSKYFRGKGGPSQIASPAWSQAGFVWATAGTMGFVRAKASPLTSQIPDGPGRALPRPSPWSHQMTHGPFGPWLPGRPRSGLAHGSLFQATPARTNPSLAPYGLAQDQPMVICPCISRKGPMPSMCNPVQIPHIRFVPFSNLMAVYHMVYCGTLRFSSLGKYRTQFPMNLGQLHCPDWARTRQTGLARSNPARALCLLSISLLKIVPFWRVFSALQPTTTLFGEWLGNLPPGDW